MDIFKSFNKLTGKEKLFNENERLNAELQELRNYLSLVLNENKEYKAEIGQLLFSLDKMQSQNQQLQLQILNMSDEIQQMKGSIDYYEDRLGPIIPINLEDAVTELDRDKSFFDYIEQITGNSFNRNQVEAIRYDMTKNLRIIAGAGSGKTETICAKVAYLIQMEDQNPARICMVTFTNKASREMKERVNKFLSVEKSSVVIGTFHSIFIRLFNALTKEDSAYKSIGIFGIDPQNGEREYKKLLKNLVSKYKLYNFDKNGEKSIFERIQYWTSLGFSIEEMCQFIRKYYDGLDNEDSPISERFKIMFQELNDIRKEREIIVFDDYLLNLYEALKKYELAREFIQNKFDYFFIDEFQDINPLQMNIVRLICPPGGRTKLIIVGDDDQSIYSFRGSDPSYIMTFPDSYETHSIKLMTNYRSKSSIVRAGNRIISCNEQDRIKKSMDPFQKQKGKAVIVVANDNYEEAHWVLTQAERIGTEKPFVFNEKEEKINYTKSTVLYRSVGQLQSMYQALDEGKIPYVIENNEDLMGVFNLSEFKSAFRAWINLLEEDSNLQTGWKPILDNLIYNFFVKKDSYKQFLSSLNTDTPAEVIQYFIKFMIKEKKNVDIEPLKKYLWNLLNIKNRKSVKMTDLVENFVRFPKVKLNLTKEEIDWIKKECEKYNTWVDLLSYHERMKQRKEKMQELIRKYHRGEYNALYFLTIHRSKGLGFENVFLIGCYDGGLPNKRAVSLKSVNLEECRQKAEPPTTIEEERRLMYVAVTRAKNSLYITFPKTLQGTPCPRSPFIKQLELAVQSVEKINKKTSIKTTNHKKQ